MARYQQTEEVKKLQREIAAMKKDHAEEIQTLADQVRKDFPDTEEGRNCFEAYWVSLLFEFKKSRTIRER
ncbi:UNVERIFIED_CONTAM: hypothetical protein Sangu_1035900 [Sesamum angustifolium]|uniref:Uncharacterized protein n=1 Tax=Sesamum angustifolium TaxID=2727405 RepID=A0AAW2NZQ4_9LAMI